MVVQLYISFDFVWFDFEKKMLNSIVRVVESSAGRKRVNCLDENQQECQINMTENEREG